MGSRNRRNRGPVGGAAGMNGFGNNAQGYHGQHHDLFASNNNNNRFQPAYHQQQQHTRGGPTYHNNNNDVPPRGPRRHSSNSQQQQSSTRTHSSSAGVHRPSMVNDNSNAGLSSKARRMKKISDAVKEQLEELIREIDELQPDKEGMDWKGSAATIVYIPVVCAADGSFLHPQVRSASKGYFPSAAEGFAGRGNGTGTSGAARRSETAGHHSSGNVSSTVTAGEGSAAETDAAVKGFGRHNARNGCVGSGEPARGDAIDPAWLKQPMSYSSQLTESGQSCLNGEHTYTQPNTSLGGQSTNQVQARVSCAPTPPNSPPRRYNHARCESESEMM